MKKTGKKTLVTATIVTAAVTMGGCRFLPWTNLNGCVYGPPPEEYDPRYNIEQPEYGAPYYYEEPTVTAVPAETLWYRLAEKRYAVLRIVSVPGVLSEGDAEPEKAGYEVEVLSFYAGDGMDLSEVSKVLLRWADRDMFSEGDVLFAELGEPVQERDVLCCEVKYGAPGPVYTGFADQQLNISDEFKLQESYEYLYDFNCYTEWNQKVNQTVSETIGEPVYFEDGMTAEDVAILFAAIEKAQKEYENASGTE